MFCKTNYQAIYGKKSIPLINLSKKNYEIIKKLELATFKMSKDKTDKYFLIMPKIIDKREDIQNRKPIISLDPGVRTFHTGYDPTGLILESGSLIKPKLDEICNKIAKIENKDVQLKIVNANIGFLILKEEDIKSSIKKNNPKLDDIDVKGIIVTLKKFLIEWRDLKKRPKKILPTDEDKVLGANTKYISSLSSSQIEEFAMEGEK